VTDQLPPERVEPAPAWAPLTQASVPSPAGLSGLVMGAGVILIVISVLVGIFAIFAMFAGIVMDDFSSFYGNQSGLTQEQGRAAMAMGRTFIFAFGAIGLAVATGHLVSGIGVLRRRGWARILGLVLGALGILIWGLALVGSMVAAASPMPAGYLESSGLTLEEYRAITQAGAIIGIAITGIALAAYLYILVVLATKGREFV